jgi:predicted ester cyclase
MAVDLKQTSRRLIEEAFGRGNLGVFEELCGEEYRAHDPLTGDTDREGAKQNCRMYREAFPDLKPLILSSYTDGEVCVLHWRMTGTHQKELMGLEPMGARCTVEGITIDRYKGGKVVESWTHWDALGLMRQLGVAPTVGAVEAKRAAERQRQRHV